MCLKDGFQIKNTTKTAFSYCQSSKPMHDRSIKGIVRSDIHG
ncbi:hypothetical protein ACZ87_00666 [Candidatus Erwinia dacicola]|uniref:Uncharacterized protein n=1 Tax=Candidatus Erwinia dacicola TaxID=252393 RepID=A0A328TXI6_9GAMM|nr:hypothetical protein ACZ87_00666 [Candidatus Erwinia dacicola]